MSNLHPIFEGIVSAWQSPPRESQLPSTPMAQPSKTQTNRTGTPLAKPKGMKPLTFNDLNPRCRVVEYHGSNRATFECVAAGHRFKRQMFPRAPNGKFPAEALLVKFVRYWGRPGPGVIMKCPKCER